jgi:hypothetical protein
MLHSHWHRRKWQGARVVPLALLMLTASSQSQAQQTTTPAPAAGAVTPEVVAPPGTLPESQSVPAPTCTAPADDPPKSVWAKVPPVTPIPRLGNYFYVPPTGPGYYSLLDWLEGNYREKPPKFPWPPFSADAGSFFDNDFRYLDDPKNTQHDYLDPIKRIHLGDNWLLSIGGEERVRAVNEVDSRLSGRDNNYQLLRTRVYSDLWYRDRFRVYAEFIDAQSYNQHLAPLPIDVNHSDLLNLFGELKLFEVNDNPVYFRAGRQELLYGSERLISPLDWANTRRTFQGYKVYYHSEKLDVDAFWVQPVIISPHQFDSPDDGQQFAGSWVTYRPQKGQTVDLYYLYLDNTRPVATGFRNAVGGYNVSTFGSRYVGDYHHVLWDFEGMYQFGDWANQETSAGAFTTGLGYNFADLPLNPTFWVYYDWASGDHNPGLNQHGTFNQLFPFGHYYFGFIDVVGRQNIEDLNLHAYIRPTKWIVTGLQYHMFRLESAQDALYNAAGAAIRRDPTGRAGTDVGDEIDYIANFHLSMHQDILVGYSKLFAGAFIRRTGPPGSPEYFYLQYSYRW